MTQDQANQTKQPKPKQTAKKTKSSGNGWVITRRVLAYVGIPVLLLVCLYIGLYIGYVRLGDQPADEIWQFSTWKHMYDLVFSDG